MTYRDHFCEIYNLLKLVFINRNYKNLMYRLSDLITQIGEMIVMELPNGGVTDTYLPLEKILKYFSTLIWGY